MTNTEELERLISESGLKKQYIARSLGLSRQGLDNKIKNRSEFTTSQVNVLCFLLNIKSLKQKECVFFVHAQMDALDQLYEEEMCPITAAQFRDAFSEAHSALVAAGEIKIDTAAIAVLFAMVATKLFPGVEEKFIERFGAGPYTYTEED